MLNNLTNCIVEIDHRYVDCAHRLTSLKQMNQIDDAIRWFKHKNLMIFLDDVHVSSSNLDVHNLIKDYEIFFNDDSTKIEVCYESAFLSINHESRLIADNWLRQLGSEVVESFDRGERQQISIKYFDCHNQSKYFPMYHIIEDEYVPTCALLSFTWWVHRYFQCIENNALVVGEHINQSVITIISDAYSKVEKKVEHLVYELYVQNIIPRMNISSQWINKVK